MKALGFELSRRVVLFSILFSATALQLFPIPGLGMSGLTTKHVLVIWLVGYLCFNLIVYERGRMHASVELQVFALLYASCILALLLNGMILPPGDGYIEGFVEFSYLLPVLFALYYLFDGHFRLQEKFIRSVALIMYASIVAFIAYFSVRAHIDVIGAFKSFFSGGGTLQYQLFAATFSYVNEDAGSSARHTMMYLFFLLLVLIRVSRDLECGTDRRSPFTGFEVLLMLTIVVVGMSRKVVLTLFVFLILYYLVTRRFSVTKEASRYVRSIAISVGVIVVLAAGIASLNSGALDLFRYKYIEDVLNNDRIHQYMMSIDQVTSSLRLFVSGAGLGQRIAGDTHFPHNMLFYFFHQVGIIGLLTAVALYGFTISLLVKALVMAFRCKFRNASYIALASAACLLVPITRMSVGDRGAIAMEGALGLALGLVLLDQAVRAARQRPILIGRLAGGEHLRKWQIGNTA